MERTLYDSEQKDFGESFQAFLTEHAVPHFEQWERDGIVPREFYSEAGRHGFMAFEADEEFGGPGGADTWFTGAGPADSRFTDARLAGRGPVDAIGFSAGAAVLTSNIPVTAAFAVPGGLGGTPGAMTSATDLAAILRITAPR